MTALGTHRRPGHPYRTVTLNTRDAECVVTRDGVEVGRYVEVTDNGTCWPTKYSHIELNDPHLPPEARLAARWAVS